MPSGLPGCYAYGADHSAAIPFLPAGKRFQGQALVDRVIALVMRTGRCTCPSSVARTLVAPFPRV